jgi:hypothetical protein
VKCEAVFTASSVGGDHRLCENTGAVEVRHGDKEIFEEIRIGKDE